MNIALTEYSLELGVGLSFLHHGQVVAERAQARLELVVVESPRPVLVEVFEHHRELLQGVLAHTCKFIVTIKYSVQWLP